MPCIALSRVLIRHQTVSNMQANSCSEPGLLPHCKPLCLPGLMTNGMRVFSKTTQMLPLGMASTICSTLRLSRVGGHRQTNCAHRACCDSARSVPSHFPRPLYTHFSDPSSPLLVSCPVRRNSNLCSLYWYTSVNVVFRIPFTNLSLPTPPLFGVVRYTPQFCHICG